VTVGDAVGVWLAVEVADAEAVDVEVAVALGTVV
jgi:hypothetical protein